MVAKWFQLVDRDGRAIGPAAMVTVGLEIANGLKVAVSAVCPRTLAHVECFDLTVYENQTTFAKRLAPLPPSANIHSFGNTQAAALIVVVPLRKRDLSPLYSTVEIPSPEATTDVFWFGANGKMDNARSIDLASDRTLPRIALIREVVGRLHASRVVQVEAPRGTGKTALAALVCRNLTNRALWEKKPIAVANLSMARQAFDTDPTFRATFQRQCGIDWVQFTAKAGLGYKLYVVMDEAQWVYPSRPDILQDFSEFWQLVQSVHTNPGDIYVLLLARVGSRMSDPRFSSPVKTPVDHILCIDKLNLNFEEIRHLVTKKFGGEDDLNSDDEMTQFCEAVQALTGGHVGVCAAAVDALNDRLDYRMNSRLGRPTAAEWIDMLQLRSRDGQDLIKCLETKFVIAKLDDGLDKRLEDLLTVDSDSTDFDNSDNEPFCSKIITECIVRGVLAYYGSGQLEFSSPAQWGYFVKQCTARVQRAETTSTPVALADLMERNLRVFEANDIRVEQRCRLNGALLKRALELAFYKAVLRETPPSTEIYICGSALYGSPTQGQLEVREGEQAWSIELLHEVHQVLDDLHGDSDPYEHAK